MGTRLVAAIATGLCATGALGQTVISDTEFEEEDWEGFLIYCLGGEPISIGPFEQQEEDGNPGAFRRGSHNSVECGPFVGQLYVAETYDPAAQGAISTIDFTYDWKDFSSIQQRGLLVEQEGRLYVRFHEAVQVPDWSSRGVFGVVGGTGTWDEVTEDGNIDGAPDFSAAGAPMTFGFYHASGGGLRDWGIDNFEYTIHTCPPDCNNDQQLSVLDFVCFQQEWVNETPAGDCDANGVYNVLDFVCFQGQFVEGCEF